MAYRVEFVNKKNEVQDVYVRTTEQEANELCNSLNADNLFPETGSWRVQSI